jgi:mono/diheme cytochrome c family protein
VHGFGQSVSIDLSDIGDKPWQLLDLTFVKGEPTLAQWVEEHFSEPRRITPGFRKEELPPTEEEIFPSFMPDVGLTDQQAKALTVYMLSLTDESLPAKYVKQALPTPAPGPYASSLEAGHAVFEQYGCAGCHGPGGLGGRKNWNSQLVEEVPALVYERIYYDREHVKDLIRNGRQPVPRQDASRPVPPLYMPAFKDRISEDELDHLVDYLFSLYDQVPQEVPISNHETSITK